MEPHLHNVPEPSPNRIIRKADETEKKSKIAKAFSKARQYLAKVREPSTGIALHLRNNSRTLYLPPVPVEVYKSPESLNMPIVDVKSAQKVEKQLKDHIDQHVLPHAKTCILDTIALLKEMHVLQEYYTDNTLKMIDEAVNSLKHPHKADPEGETLRSLNLLNAIIDDVEIDKTDPRIQSILLKVLSQRQHVISVIMSKLNSDHIRELLNVIIPAVYRDATSFDNFIHAKRHKHPINLKEGYQDTLDDIEYQKLYIIHERLKTRANTLAIKIRLHDELLYSRRPRTIPYDNPPSRTDPQQLSQEIQAYTRQGCYSDIHTELLDLLNFYATINRPQEDGMGVDRELALKRRIGVSMRFILAKLAELDQSSQTPGKKITRRSDLASFLEFTARDLEKQRVLYRYKPLLEKHKRDPARYHMVLNSLEKTFNNIDKHRAVPRTIIDHIIKDLDINAPSGLALTK